MLDWYLIDFDLRISAIWDDVTDFGQQQIRWRLVAWKRQSITSTSVHLSTVKTSGNMFQLNFIDNSIILIQANIFQICGM